MRTLVRTLVIKRRNLKSTIFALTLIGTFVTVALIKRFVDNGGHVPSKRNTYLATHNENVSAIRSLKRRKFCSVISTNSQETKWKTVHEWDYQHYNTSHFLKNFKNPCYLTNTSGQDTRRAPILSARGLLLQCLPYFIIAGFPKSGTTDLWFRLMSHPDIKLRHHKELNFFNIGRLKAERFDRVAARYTSIYDRAAAELQRLVSPNDCQEKPFPYHHGITGEGSVDAVFDNKRWTQYPGNEYCTEPVITTADYVHQINPNMKVIFMIRNPTERLYSDYIYEARFVKYPTGIQLFHDSVNRTMKKHAECRKYHSIRACAYNDTIEDIKIRLRVGMYHIFISDWLDLFTKKNVLVIDAADTDGQKRSATYKRILKFLNIRPFTRLEELLVFKRPDSNKRLEEEVKIGEMLPETRELIDQFYEPFNRNLAELYPEIDYNTKKVSGQSKGNSQ